MTVLETEHLLHRCREIKRAETHVPALVIWMVDIFDCLTVYSIIDGPELVRTSSRMLCKEIHDPLLCVLPVTGNL